MANKTKFELDQFGFDSSLDISNLDFSKAPKIKNDRSPTTHTAIGVAKGIKKSVITSAFITNAIKAALPKGYGTAADFVGKSTSGIKNLYNDTARDIKPLINDIKRTTDKVVTAADSAIPKNIAEKIKKWTKIEQSAYRSMSPEEQRDAALRMQLGEIFNLQTQTTLKQSARDTARENIKTGLEHSRHKDQMSQLDAMRISLQQIANYQQKIDSGFQRKSLELQFRHYYVAKDTLEEMRVFNTNAMLQYQTIAKNTGLPDFVKLKTSERLKEVLRNNFINAASAKIDAKRKAFFKDFTDSLLRQAKGKLSGFSNGAREGMGYADHLDQAGGMASMADNPHEERGDMAGTFFGSLLSGSLGTFLGKKAKPLINKYTKGKVGNSIHRVGHKLQYFHDDAQQAALETANNWDPKKHGKVLNAVAKFLGDAVKNTTISSTGLKSDNLKDMQQPAPFSRQIAKSITEIIPGYLARMLREMQMTRTGKPSELTHYDFTRNKFVGETTLRRTIHESIVNKTAVKDIRASADRIIDTVDKNKKLSPEARKHIGEQLVRNNIIKNISGTKRNLTDAKHFQGKAEPHAAAWISAYNEYLGNDEAGHKENHVREMFRDVGQHMEDVRSTVEDYDTAGYGSHLSKMGFTKTGEDTISVATLTKKERDLLIKLGILYKDRNYINVSAINSGNIKLIESMGLKIPSGNYVNLQGISEMYASGSGADEGDSGPGRRRRRARVPFGPRKPQGPSAGLHAPSSHADQQFQHNTQQRNMQSKFDHETREAMRHQGKPFAHQTGNNPLNSPVYEHHLKLAKERAKQISKENAQGHSNASRFEAFKNFGKRKMADLHSFAEHHQINNRAHAAVGGVRNTLEDMLHFGTHKASEAKTMFHGAVHEAHAKATAFKDSVKEADLKNKAASHIGMAKNTASGLFEAAHDKAVGWKDRIKAKAKETVTATKHAVEELSKHGMFKKHIGMADLIPGKKGKPVSALASIDATLKRIEKKLKDGIGTGGGTGKVKGTHWWNKSVLGAAGDLGMGAVHLAGHAAHMANSVVGGAFSNAWKIGKFGVSATANTLGWGKDKLMNLRDVWVKGEDKPRLLASKLRNGYYVDQKTRKPVRKFKDITGTLLDENGDIALYDYEIPRAYLKGKLGAVLLSSVGAVFKGVNSLVNAYTGVIGTAVKAGIWTGKKLFSLTKRPQDVYSRDDLTTPKLTARTMRAGGYVSAVTGKVINHPGDIDGPVNMVVNGKVEQAMSAAEVASGVLDRNGKPIKTGIRKLLGIAGSIIGFAGRQAMSIGRSINKTIGHAVTAGKHVVGFAKDTLLHGITGWGKDHTGTSIGKKGADIGIKLLTEIRNILKSRLPESKKHILGDIDGSGIREGSFQDEVRKGLVPGESSLDAYAKAHPSSGGKGGVLGMLGGLFGKKDKGEGGDGKKDEEGHPVRDMVEGELVERGIEKGAGKFGRALKWTKNLAKGGASKGLKLLSKIPGLSKFAKLAAMLGGTAEAANLAGSALSSTSAAPGLMEAGGVASKAGILSRVAGIGKAGLGMAKGAMSGIGGLAGKLLMPLTALMSAGEGIAGEANGQRIDSIGKVIPKGWGMLNPFEWAMNGGRYAGNKINSGLDSITGGQGIGSKIYDWTHGDEAKKLSTASTPEAIAAAKARIEKAKIDRAKTQAEANAAGNNASGVPSTSDANRSVNSAEDLTNDERDKLTTMTHGQKLAYMASKNTAKTHKAESGINPGPGPMPVSAAALAALAPPKPKPLTPEEKAAADKAKADKTAKAKAAAVAAAPKEEGFWSRVGSSISEGASTAYNGAINATGAGIDAVANADYSVKGIANMGHHAVAGASNLYKSAVSATASGIENTVNTVKSGVSAVKSAYNSAVDTAADAMMAVAGAPRKAAEAARATYNKAIALASDGMLALATGPSIVGKAYNAAVDKTADAMLVASGLPSKAAKTAREEYNKAIAAAGSAYGFAVSTVKSGIAAVGKSVSGVVNDAKAGWNEVDENGNEVKKPTTLPGKPGTHAISTVTGKPVNKPSVTPATATGGNGGGAGGSGIGSSGPVGVTVGDKKGPRGIRNNNPGNINFAHQAGAKLEDGPGGRFAVFATMEEGISALARQIHLFVGRGINTVNAIISKYAPPSDNNNTSSYINSVSKKLGVTADDALDIHDNAILKGIITAITTVECGAGKVKEKCIDDGIALYFGKPKTPSTAANIPDAPPPPTAAKPASVIAAGPSGVNAAPATGANKVPVILKPSVPTSVVSGVSSTPAASSEPNGKSGNWDVNKSLACLNSNAGQNSQGRCAEFVRKAVEAGGVTLKRTTSAKDYGPSLEKVGFKPTNDGAPKAGDVAIIQPIPGHQHGHATMFNGRNWISDFIQLHGYYPGDSYRKAKPSVIFYRHASIAGAGVGGASSNEGPTEAVSKTSEMDDSKKKPKVPPSTESGLPVSASTKTSDQPAVSGSAPVVAAIASSASVKTSDEPVTGNEDSSVGRRKHGGVTVPVSNVTPGIVYGSSTPGSNNSQTVTPVTPATKVLADQGNFNRQTIGGFAPPRSPDILAQAQYHKEDNNKALGNVGETLEKSYEVHKSQLEVLNRIADLIMAKSSGKGSEDQSKPETPIGGEGVNGAVNRTPQPASRVPVSMAKRGNWR